MIYLIGGTPRSGKSVLAKKLSVILRIPHISTDNIRPVVLPYIDRRARNKQFPFLRMYESMPIDAFFAKYTGPQIFKADRREARTIWPGVRSLVDHLAACKMDYIIEGFHLLPEFLKDHKDDKNIRIAFLLKTDEEKIFHGLIKSKSATDWISGNTGDERVIRKAAKAMSVYGAFFERETTAYGFTRFNTEDDFTDTIKKTIDYLRR